MRYKAGIKKAVGVMISMLLLMAVTGGRIHAAEKTDVHVLGLWDLTGPYSAVYQLNMKGVKDVVDWVNETEYIPGVRLIHDIYDTGSDVGKAVAAYQAGMAKTPRPVISSGGWASSTILAIKPLAERNRVPCLDGSSIRPIMIPPKWTFSFLACYEGMVAACAGWIKENWKPDSKVEWIRKHYQNRPPRVSILGWDNPFGRGFDQAELRAYLKKIGVDFVQPEYIPPAPTDTSAELLRLKKAGVDFIYCPMFASAHAVVLKDAQRLGIRDDFVHICWWTSDLWQVQKFAGPLADNCLQLTGWLPLLEEWPRHFRETFQKTGLGMEYSQGYCFGLTAFDWYSDAIRRAIKIVGSAKKLDGEAIYQAVINTKDLKVMGYSCKMSFSTTKRYGPDTGDLYMMQQGKVLRIAKDLYIPDLLPGGRDVPK